MENTNLEGHKSPTLVYIAVAIIVVAVMVLGIGYFRKSKENGGTFDRPVTKVYTEEDVQKVLNEAPRIEKPIINKKVLDSLSSSKKIVQKKK